MTMEQRQDHEQARLWNGVAGAAWASVIAEWSGALLGLYLARRALRAYAGTLDWAALRRWLSPA